MSDEKPLELANRFKDAFSLTHLSVVCSVAVSIALQNVTFTSDTQLVLSSLEPQMCANLHFYRRNSCCGGASCTWNESILPVPHFYIWRKTETLWFGEKHEEMLIIFYALPKNKLHTPLISAVTWFYHNHPCMGCVRKSIYNCIHGRERDSNRDSY